MRYRLSRIRASMEARFPKKWLLVRAKYRQSHVSLRLGSSRSVYLVISILELILAMGRSAALAKLFSRVT